MRQTLLLLLAACIVHAQLSSPPLDAVMGNNSAAAAALDGYYNASYAQNGTITLRFGDYSQSPNISVSIIPIGLSPSIDNVTCVGGGTALVSARGYDAGPLVSIPYPGYPDFSCDRAWHDSNPSLPLRCDFDGDDCSEFVNRTLVRYDLNATFLYGNESATVPYSSTLLVPPPSFVSILENASGSDNLTIVINGTAVFTYEINDQYIDFATCHANYTNFTSAIQVSANRTFIVGGRQKLFFLAAPILREQWFRNNRFDVVVFSQCPLYDAQILLNNASRKNMTIRTFNMTSDEFGYMSITSKLEAADGWAEASGETVTPSQLESSNNSFAFVYSFGFGYSGLGENNLSLRISDSALSSAEYSEILLSRMLTHGGNTTETGQNASLFPSRPSAGFETGFLTHLEISLGLVGLVLILAFLNFWVPR